jgi:hypothetical protein
VEIGAAELAVGDPLEPGLFLLAHDLADAIVLDGAQGLRGNLVSEEFLARLAQAGGAQKAADVIGAERRGHVSSQSNCAIGLPLARPVVN